MSERDPATLIRYYAFSDDPDRRTSMADSRIAYCLARGVAMDDIDPASGYNYSRRAYDSCRASWVLHIRDNGWSEFYDRPDAGLDRAVATWAQHRPEFLAGDDWLAAGIAAHRERHPGATCFRGLGRCDFHPSADHAELLRLMAEMEAPAEPAGLGSGVQDSRFDEPDTEPDAA
jgi:hypothetical protein